MRKSLVKIHIDKELSAVKELRTINKESVKKTSLTLFSKRYIINLPQPVIEKQDFEKVISDSVNLLFDYSITPCATLVLDLFGELDSQKSLVVAKKLSQYRFYKYYPDTIINFIKDEDKVIVLNDEIRLLLKDTNIALYDKLVDKITGIKIKNLFVQIFKLKYFSENRINLDSTIPKTFINDFLIDKNYIDLKAKLEGIPEDGNENEFSLKDIIKYLSGKSSVAIASNQSEDEAIVLTIEDKPEIEVISELNNDEDEKIVIDIEEQEENIEVLVESNGSVELIVGEDDSDEKIVIGDEDKYYSDELIDAANDESVFPTEIIGESVIETGTSELKKIFRPYELKAISKKLFGNNKKELFAFMNKLEDCNDWESAIGELKDLFIEKNVDPYDNDVLLFVDVLQEHFSKRI